MYKIKCLGKFSSRGKGQAKIQAAMAENNNWTEQRISLMTPPPPGLECTIKVWTHQAFVKDWAETLSTRLGLISVPLKMS